MSHWPAIIRAQPINQVAIWKWLRAREIWFSKQRRGLGLRNANEMMTFEQVVHHSVASRLVDLVITGVAERCRIVSFPNNRVEGQASVGAKEVPSEPR